LSPTHYRIADVAVFVGSFPAGKEYPTDPPVLAAEVVSEDDRHVEIQEKLAEYHAWGVRHVWLVDPWTRKLFVYDSGGLRATTCFELPEFGAKLYKAEVFDQTPQQ
jgi:Uma2 family endonuclease